jgi:uncharacterized protein YndB with AHSA1/START domain
MRIDYAENEIVIEESPDKVFNFISRGARYERWHFDYHLRARVLDVREEGVGSAFSIEELIGGFYLHHVGRVAVFERNRRFVWKGRFALFSHIFIGTDFTFTAEKHGTRVREILYFEANPVLFLLSLHLFGYRVFRPAACKAHILDELSGIKRLIESGDYEQRDVTFFLDDPELMATVKRFKPLS